jgi:hypothetical protein
MGGDGDMSVRETRNKLIPILFMGCLFNPALERSERINCDFWDVCKQELEILHNKILVAEKGTSDSTSLVTARHQHLLGWVIVWSLHYLPNEVKLAGSYHITYTRYVIKHPPDVLIPDLLLFHLCH